MHDISTADFPDSWLSNDTKIVVIDRGSSEIREFETGMLHWRRKFCIRAREGRDGARIENPL